MPSTNVQKMPPNLSRRRPYTSSQSTISISHTPHPPVNTSHPTPQSPIAQYFNKRRSSQISTYDLPMEKNAIGLLSPAGVFFATIKLTTPLAYIYIVLILWRELCFSFPETMLESWFMVHYMSVGVWIAKTMRSSSLLVETWAVIEGIFYVCLILHRKWLNSLDTLELSLRSAPMLEPRERAELWEFILDSEEEFVKFITGWFFGEELEKLTRYDVMDFMSWSLFEGRNIEHLTHDELQQLRGFVSDLEYKISIELYGEEGVGEIPEEDENTDIQKSEGKDSSTEDQVLELFGPPSPTRQHFMQHYGYRRGDSSADAMRLKRRQFRPKPRKMFQFQENRDDLSSDSFFSNLYESYKDYCDQYREMIENSNFHPVQDIRNYVAEKRQQLHDAEESARATANNIYENAYFTIIEKGGNVDRQLTALSNATQSQLADAWNSVWKMKERLQTATDISERRKALRQQLKTYQQTLKQMRSMANAAPSGQMADLMRKITQCYESLERVERSAMDAFVQVTGYVGTHLLHNQEPPRYLKYSCDPLMDIASYPLMFHVLILMATDGGLRVMMKNRGFRRLRVGPISYYYHPGKNSKSSRKCGDKYEDDEKVPIVFCHGIGIGIIFYITLVDELLRLGYPLIFPEIPYVSGFRPWQGPNCVLPPAAVTSTLMSILACHGYGRGAFIGHSYGSSWVSFMCKYGPSAVAAVMFLDPICFCLHFPRLTKKFVYHRADPGSSSYMIRTDVNINWTIQRGFPWARISLFVEQIPNVPCSVFLSENDALVPSAKAEKYLRSKGAVVLDADEAGVEHFASFSGPNSAINVTVFRDQGHGDWPLVLSSNKQVAEAARVLMTQIHPSAIEDIST